MESDSCLEIARANGTLRRDSLQRIFLHMLDLLITNATLPDGRTGIDIACAKGKIADIGHLGAPSRRAQRSMPGAISYRRPSWTRISTWMRPCRSAFRASTNPAPCSKASRLWGELKPLLTHEAVMERALRYCDLAVSQGLLAIRTHVDVCDDRLLCAEALIEVRKRVAPYIDLQIVAFPQDGYYRSPDGCEKSRSRARHGRRCRRRHPAFRAHHGGWCGKPQSLVRDRGQARASRRHSLRRDRRSAVAPYRDLELRDAKARASRPRRRLASDLDAFDGQLLCLEAHPPDGRGGHARNAQSAHQHHHPGPA